MTTATLVKENSPQIKQTIHPATLLFQALSIVVNDELGILKSTLDTALQSLKPDGIIGVISFHSLEDRIIKHFFKDAAAPKRSDRGKIIETSRFAVMTKKPLVASYEETRINPRARSAKLRAIRRLP